MTSAFVPFLLDSLLSELEPQRTLVLSTPDECFFQQALIEARRGMGRTFPNPPVGCVIVKDQKVVGTGHHQKAGGPHAEVFALQQAKEQAAGATLYVTLEPCSHHGKTPPCADAIVKAKIKRVIVGVVDPNPAVKGQGIARLKAAGIAVSVVKGPLHQEAQAVIAAFRMRIEENRPYVIAKVAATLDGKIAMRTGDSQWVTGEKSRQVVHSLRAGLDGVLVGSGTVLKDNPSLTVRTPLESKIQAPFANSGSQPRRIVIDGGLRTSPDAKIYQNLPTDRAAPLVVHSPMAQVAQKDRFAENNIALAEIKLAKNEAFIDVRILLKELAAQGMTSLLLEAGPHLLRAFLQAELVDELWWFTAPKLAGADGHAALGALELERMQDALELKEVQAFLAGKDHLWVGRFPKN